MPFRKVIRSWFRVHGKKLLALTANQLGISQIILPLLIIAGIGLSVYLVQQRTNLIPYAAENCQTTSSPDGTITSVKEVESKAKQLGQVKCTEQPEGINVSCPSNVNIKLPAQTVNFQVSCIKTRLQTVFWDGIDPAHITGYIIHFTWSDGHESWDFKNGGGLLERDYGFLKRGNKVFAKNKDNELTNSYVLTDFKDHTFEYNQFDNTGENMKYNPTKSFALYSSTYTGGAPGDASAIAAQVLGGTSGTTGTSAGQTVTSTATSIGSSSSTKSPSPSKSPAASKAPDNSNNNPTGGTSAGTSGTTTAPGGGGGTTVPSSLTKNEITKFQSSFSVLYTRLGTTKNTGNLKIVSEIANTELASLVSDITNCKDDAAVGTCLEKYRERFNFAKTAARLSAFYAIFNGVGGICGKADFGLTTLITAVSDNNITARVNLCQTQDLVKIWRVFTGAFRPIIATDTRWPANPTCITPPNALPNTEPINVLEHYRQAEILFKNRPGFVENTPCNGIGTTP